MRPSLSSLVATGAVAGLLATFAGSPPGAAADPRASAERVRCEADHIGAAARERDFAAASRAAGVPVAVLKAVSYQESRWDDHGGAPSTAGGYGPMHLTDAPMALESDGRGEGAARRPLLSLETVRLASSLTGLPATALRTDPTANICGGAAVLAYLQHGSGHVTGARTAPGQWADAVARYSGSGDPATAGSFVDRVYTTLQDGAARRTSDGQRVQLAPHPRVRVPQQPSRLQQSVSIDCPRSLSCWWVPAPYEWYGRPDPYAYGNHDLADRPNDLSIDYIVVHDTEATWDTTLDLVTDPTYVSWQYSIRSSDGQVAEHVHPDDVAWQAGNWYMNTHSIGIEHEGVAAAGAAWYTESMYESSAALVRYLTRKYDIARDRAHIIGHDQVPGITPDYVAGMHWDPGPYWDWEHYMELVNAPIGGERTSQQAGASTRVQVGDTVTVRPGFDDNVQPVTGCDTAGEPCDPQGTNFVHLHRRPDVSSPLVTDEGLRPDGSPSTTAVSDIGARAAAGQELVVAKRREGWLKVWWLGAKAWLDNSATGPVALPSNKLQVRLARGVPEAPVYGRAYPEESAYPDAIPYQTVTPLQYALHRRQSYVLADASVPTEYYYAQTFDRSLPKDHSVVRGGDRYYQIWFGHRLAYVRAADVRIVSR